MPWYFVRKPVRESRPFFFCSIVLCCVSFALVLTAFATEYWFTANCYDSLLPRYSTGEINLGLFSGNSTLQTIVTVSYGYKIVCADGDCIYSKYESQTEREDSLQELQNAAGSDVEFLSEALWLCTIIFMALGEVFVIVAALFAVLNIATKQFYAITGAPGLFLWNGIAALFYLVSTICWLEQHIQNMNYVLVEETSWRTENETLGYSYWLVVSSAFVEVVNCLVLFIGTYEWGSEELETVAPFRGKDDFVY